MMVIVPILKTCNLLNLIFVSKGENIRTTFVSNKGFISFVMSYLLTLGWCVIFVVTHLKCMMEQHDIKTRP